MTAVCAGSLRADLRIHQTLDGRELRGGHGLKVREVEAQPIGRHQRAFLLHVSAEHLAQRRMQQMRGGMIQYRGGAPRTIHLCRELIAQRGCGPRPALPTCAKALPRFDGVIDHEANAGAGQFPGIADLAAGLGVEGRGLEKHLAAARPPAALPRPRRPCSSATTRLGLAASRSRGTGYANRPSRRRA